jgi:hypothetical protein
LEPVTTAVNVTADPADDGLALLVTVVAVATCACTTSLWLAVLAA